VSGTFGGHKDWSVAQYTGAIGWLNYAEDWDFNLMLLPQNGAGVTDQNHLAKGVKVDSAAAGRTPYIELEFDSNEIVGRFQTSWWSKLRDAAKASKDPADGSTPILNENEEKHDILPCGAVYGILGLDAEHGGASEVHPVHALAIQVDDRPNTNTWAIFARNWGNGGYCSHYDHQLKTDGGSLWVLLPRVTNAAPLEINFELPGNAAPPHSEFWPGKGLAIQFKLPPPQSQGLAEAVVRLRWADNTGTFSCPVAQYTDSHLLNTIEDATSPDSIEGYLRSLLKPGPAPKLNITIAPTQHAEVSVDVREPPAPKAVKPTGRLSVQPAAGEDLLDRVCAAFAPGQEPTNKIDLRKLCAKQRKK